MADPQAYGGGEDESILGSGLTTRQLEAFGRKVTTTANHLMAPISDASTSHYSSAMTDLHRGLRRPGLQQRVFSFAHTPAAIVRTTRASAAEVQQRALTYLPDELLTQIPDGQNAYSLLDGFKATVADDDSEPNTPRRRGQKLLDDGKVESGLAGEVAGLKKDRDRLMRRLEMMAVKKNLCSSEIREVDNKIANLSQMRRIVLDRLADVEVDEAHLEHELMELENKLEDLQEELDDQAFQSSPAVSAAPSEPLPAEESKEPGFMSESIYEKLPPSTPAKTRKPKPKKRKSMPILHEHYEPGTMLKEIPAHNDTITALDFDAPFGTLVTAALDDTVRVWDLSLGRCMGFLEGHTASVRCIQVEDNIVATGSMDASIRLWDLSRAQYTPMDARASRGSEAEEEDDGLGFGNEDEDAPPPPPPSSMEDCPLFTLEAHVAEVTALHFKNDTLVSGSADKTLRQWDLVKGRCVQTLDVLWAAAQATASNTLDSASTWRPTGSSRVPDSSADFVGAIQCFETALACGTADGMVRLWDLRSGQVHRSLVGHTGAVTCLQFDDVHLVTGSADRSIRIWDLRTGSIHDAYAYDAPITSMQFDTRRIVSAAGEDVVKVYDKTDGRHWDCGAGVKAAEEGRELGSGSIVERVRIKEGVMVEGRRDGGIGVWTC